MKLLENTTRVVLLVVIVALAAVVAVQRLSRAPAKVEGEAPEERSAAVARVAAKRPPGAAGELARVTSDASAPVRAGALAGLAHVLTPEHRPVVVKSTRDPDPRTRAIAAGTLSKFADKAAADVLINMAHTDENEEVVRAALQGVGKCKDDPRAIVTLMAMAEKGRTDEIKMTAMSSLARMMRARIAGRRRPQDKKNWADLVQRWKEDHYVKQAHAAAGMPLVHRPQDKTGKAKCNSPAGAGTHKVSSGSK
jgi:HEAT repeat protein